MMHYSPAQLNEKPRESAPLDFDSSTLLLKAGTPTLGDDGLWSPHESPFIRWLIEHWTAKEMNRFGAIQSELESEPFRGLELLCRLL